MNTTRALTWALLGATWLLPLQLLAAPAVSTGSNATTGSATATQPAVASAGVTTPPPPPAAAPSVAQVPAAAPPTAAQPAAAPTNAAPPPAPTAAPALAAESVSTDAPTVDTGVASELPYYTPTAGEVYVPKVVPPPPKPPAPPGMKIELGAYYQFQSLVGGYGASGFIQEIGIGIGFTRLRILLGLVPNNTLAVLGLQFPNLTGWKLATFDEKATLSILAPNFHVKVATNFAGGDFFGTLGAHAIGLAYVNCSGFPIAIKVRGPSFALWVPFASQGQSIPDTRVLYGFGAGIDVGVPLF